MHTKSYVNLAWRWSGQEHARWGGYFANNPVGNAAMTADWLGDAMRVASFIRVFAILNASITESKTLMSGRKGETEFRVTATKSRVLAGLAGLADLGLFRSKFATPPPPTRT